MVADLPAAQSSSRSSTVCVTSQDFCYFWHDGPFEMKKVVTVLIELLCFASFVACGVVVGFCAGGLFGPRLLGRGGQGLEELGFMFNGAILGALAGAVTGLFTLRLPRNRRRNLAVLAVGIGASSAGLTALAVKLFNAW